MENDNLDKLWGAQAAPSLMQTPHDILAKAKQQRNKQYISISIMSCTVVVLISYALFYSYFQWNSFNGGLFLMIFSLSFRIVLEFYSLHRKEQQLISMTQKSYHRYLKKYYKTRRLINWAITPVCIAVYTFGFYLLLPYFKASFSSGFYTYVLISGFLSIAIITVIIANTIRKEERFLKHLTK